jgi:hypothetical protein
MDAIGDRIQEVVVLLVDALDIHRAITDVIMSAAEPYLLPAQVDELGIVPAIGSARKGGACRYAEHACRGDTGRSTDESTAPR